MKQNILMIFSDKQIYHELQTEIESTTICVVLAETLDDAIRLYTKNDFCLVIMDAAISNSDGQKLLAIMQTIHPTPILLLSSNGTHENRKTAFDAGATAYLALPYSIDDCVAQAKSLIRFYNDMKSYKSSKNVLTFGTELIIDTIKRKVYYQEQPIELTKKEFDLLYFMASHPGQVFTKDQLYESIWNADYSINVDDSVKAQIKTLRKNFWIRTTYKMYGASDIASIHKKERGCPSL